MDKLLKLLARLRERFLPRAVLRYRDGALQRLLYRHGRWQQVSEDEPRETSLFGQEILLIPDSATLFRLREFPIAHINKQELAEAVQLDIANWSPWEGDCHYYYWPGLTEDKWQVAVWIWPADTLGKPTETHAAAASSVTHIMPEFAWRLASLDPAGLPAHVINRELEGAPRAALVLPSGVPGQVSEFIDAAAEQRFWNSREDEMLEWPVLEDPVIARLPGARALFYARKPGVQDWTDPMAWLRPALLTFGLYLFWLLGSGLVLWQKVDGVDDMVGAAQSAATEVIAQRERVTEIHATLNGLKRLRHRQAQFEEFLAVLSKNLPADAWVDALQYSLEDGGTVDLSGKAGRSAGLVALLEALPEVEHAMFLGDIRREKDSGLEPFKIRLKLAQGGSP